MDTDDEELKEKLKRAFGEHADEGAIEDSPMPDTSLPDTSELDARLKAVTVKTDAYKKKTEQNTVDLEKARKTEQADARGLGTGLQIAYTIAGCPLLGFGAGALVDFLTHANIWKGIMGMAGCLLGVVSAIMLINRFSASS